MYVGGRGNGNRRQGNMQSIRDNGMERFAIPNEYSGNALRDPEALKKAEEAFRRGYVFENDESTVPNEEKSESLAEEENTEGEIHNTDVFEHSEVTSEINVETNAVDDSLTVEASAAPVGRIENVSGNNGFISGLFHNITTEHIILIAAILILWDSRADDELMIMLAILLFC